MKKTIYIGSAFALVTVLAWYLVQSGSVAKGKAGIVADKSISYMYNFDTKKKTAYGLHFIQNTLFNKNKDIPRDSSMVYNINTILNMRILEKEKGQIWSAFQLSLFDLRGTGTSNEVTEALKPYYESMFLVKHDSSWIVKEMYFPGKIENFSGLKQIIYLLEVINLNKRGYRLKQLDSLGQYEAFYKKNSEIIRKQKKQYITNSNIGGNYTVKVKKYHLNATIDRVGNWLKALKINEHLTLSNQDIGIRIDNKNTIELNKIKEGDINKSLDIWLEKRTVTEILKDFKILQKNDTDILKRLSEKQARKDFRQKQIDLDMLAIDIRTNLHKIKDFIKVFPEQTFKLEEFIQNANDADSMKLIAVLSLVGTPQAQKLLIDLASDSISTHTNQIRSVIALGSIESPTIETVDALEELSNARGDELEIDRSNTALLALSSHANNTDYRKNIIEYVSSAYYNTSSLSRKKNALLAMQNAGAENFLQEIGQSLESKSTKERRFALEALATIKDKELRARLLTQQLERQENSSLKELIKKYLKGV